MNLIDPIQKALDLFRPRSSSSPSDLPTTVPGWEVLSETLRDFPGKLLSTLPPDKQRDPQIQQEVARLSLKSLATSILDALGSDGNHPAFVPNQNLFLNFPMPNADTVYRTSRITPGGTYRLRGTRGSSTIANLVQIAPRPTGANKGGAANGAARTNLDLNELPLDQYGHFDVVLSPERPEGYSGVWWKLQEGSHLLLLRLVSANWENEEDSRISIERLDHPARLTRPTAKELEHLLHTISQSFGILPQRFVAHTEQLKAKGIVNRLENYDLSQSGGLSGQSYCEGVFDIGDGEGLLLEVKAPSDCTYWSIILGDELHQTLDWANNHSSLNSLQGKPDSDGLLRFVIADEDPGVPNWLDTAGHRQGTVQLRWFGSTAGALPVVRKIRLTELALLMPRDTTLITPEQREESQRKRRASVQQRALW